MATFDDIPGDDGLFTMVRPTRWKSRDDGATVDPDMDDELDTTSYTLGPDTPSPAKDDDDDHVELGMDDISAEWTEPPGEDEAALGHLLASAERALESVRRIPRREARPPSPRPRLLPSARGSLDSDPDARVAREHELGTSTSTRSSTSTSELERPSPERFARASRARLRV